MSILKNILLHFVFFKIILYIFFYLNSPNLNLITLLEWNDELRNVTEINQFNYEIQSNHTRVICSDKRIAWLMKQAESVSNIIFTNLFLHHIICPNFFQQLSCQHLFIYLYLYLCRDSWISTWSPRLAMPRAKYSTSRWRVTTTGISQKSPLVRPEIVRIDLSLHISLSMRSFSWDGSKWKVSSRNTRSSSCLIFRNRYRCDCQDDWQTMLNLNHTTCNIFAKLAKILRTLLTLILFSTAFDYISYKLIYKFLNVLLRMNIYSTLACDTITSTDASVICNHL